MSSVRRARFVPTVAAVLAACAGGPESYTPRPEPAKSPPSPPAPATGMLAIRVVYPPTTQAAGSSLEGTLVVTDSTYRLARRDSVFLLGSVGRGSAGLFVNGHEVPVYPTGGWIAWVPLAAAPGDTIAGFDLLAREGDTLVRTRLDVPLEPAFDPGGAAVWIDTLSLEPRGDRWVRPGEGIRLSVRASPGATVRGILPDGRVIPFVPDREPEPLPWGERAFATPQPPSRPPPDDRYAAWWVGPLGPDPGGVLAPSPQPAADDARLFVMEATVGSDTARTRWPLRVGAMDPANPVVIVVDDDPEGTGSSDSTLAGRPGPHGTYHWFFPTGTLAVVSGRWNDQVRLQLSRGSVAWVDAQDVRRLPEGAPPPGGAVRSLRLTAGSGSVVLRIPLPARVPFRVDELERELALTAYGVMADMDWIQYGGTDSLVRLIEFVQRAEDEATIRVALAEPVWGYRTRWDGNDLLLEVRRPPPIDRRRPLAGRLVVLDPGHPPLGATGPTGTREADVALAVAQRAQAVLERHGARVILTRTTDSAVSLVERTRLAEQVDADVLVSIHANALPDGVNPFVNNGTSVYYFHPRSAPLARALDHALVRQFGFRDLGIGRGDLALARPTWMPAVLAEGLFLMLPDQEAVLASAEGQRRYVLGIVEGVAEFLALRGLNAER